MEDDMKHVGPMAQDVLQKFPERVFQGEDGFLRIRLDDLPPGITPYDLAAPVHPAGVAAAHERWCEVFRYWKRRHEDEAEKVSKLG